jgi:hypothetical protein
VQQPGGPELSVAGVVASRDVVRYGATALVFLELGRN